MQHHLLLVAAGALALLGIIHSYLGERFVLSRILALPDLPKLRGSREYMQSLLRWAWHLTSVAWWGTAATLVALWAGRGPAAFGAVLAIHLRDPRLDQLRFVPRAPPGVAAVFPRGGGDLVWHALIPHDHPMTFFLYHQAAPAC